jgi:putative exosortase-associated protein (TIGR04073 family)
MGFTTGQFTLICTQRIESIHMRNTFSLLAVLAMTGVLGSGCANMEKKFGSGLSNTFEITRLGDLRRSMEQTALFDSPDVAYTTGFVRGLNRTLARTGVGVYQIVTCPFPPYDPPFPHYLSAEPVYPDSYKPGLVADSSFDTDTYTGFSGGDVMPRVPGSRFKIFDSR